MEFDYLKILKAYIRHIGMMEGISFLGSRYHVRGLTKEENEELIRIDDENDEEDSIAQGY